MIVTVAEKLVSSHKTEPIHGVATYISSPPLPPTTLAVIYVLTAWIRYVIGYPMAPAFSRLSYPENEKTGKNETGNEIGSSLSSAY
ncbi:hypothetical protein CEXT_53511 [Caerostris extrusa]|uniref:Uncharacterized protein n=1 Tax=Caerostris extrusa TaxID=172846 RepID=A0AAV4TSE1_CAEEX|nr:hypothetical protein CEXT_53511 [Caerostris extrusa]